MNDKLINRCWVLCFKHNLENKKTLFYPFQNCAECLHKERRPSDDEITEILKGINKENKCTQP